MKKKITIKKKPTVNSTRKNNRIAYLAKQFIGRNIMEGQKNKYDFSVKDKAGNVLPDHFSKITKEDFEEIIKADPTANKQYSQWLLTIYAKGNLVLEDLYKATEDLEKLYKFKTKVDQEKRDINQCENLDDLYSVIEKLVQLPDDQLLSNTQLAKKVKLEGAEVHLDTDRWRVLSPLNVEAARLYGSGTRWCTASAGHNQFEYYVGSRHPNSKLYIIIDKQATPDNKTTHKYQFHFETKQFMNALDHSVDYLKLLKENEELLTCFTSLKDGNGLRLKFLFGMDLSPEDKIIKNGNCDWLREYQADELPESLEIHGDVDLSNCRAKRVKNLKVLGNLNISNSDIEEIHGKFEVGGIFDAQDSKLRHLPEGTCVKDSIVLRNSKITKLPSKLYVGGHLFASYLLLSEVPQDIEVKENIYLHGAGFTEDEFPASVKVGGKIFATKLKEYH